MDLIDEVLTKAVETRDVPFAVAMVGNRDGVLHASAAGMARDDLPAGADTVFRIFSMTKAIGACAAMSLIDQGKLTMDTPVAEVLPEWDKLEVLEGWSGDRPILRAPETRATIRHLATHTSGLEYGVWNANMQRYLRVTGHPVVPSGRKKALFAPLMSDPGTQWAYGTGIDWLGQIVEAVDGRGIDQFCREEIFAPLHMDDTVFEADAHQERLANAFRRDPDGGFAQMEMGPPRQPDFYGMGHALYSTPSDYMRFLRMLLNGGVLDGARILSAGAVRDMCANQTLGLGLPDMKSQQPGQSLDVIMPEGTSHSFMAVRYEKDMPGRRRAGSQSWAGICNTHYWLDPAADIAAVFMTQTLPFLDWRFLRQYEAFERAVYAQYGPSL